MDLKQIREAVEKLPPNFSVSLNSAGVVVTHSIEGGSVQHAAIIAWDNVEQSYLDLITFTVERMQHAATQAQSPDRGA